MSNPFLSTEDVQNIQAMPVHNHGPEDGPGHSCREYPTLSGKPRGACLDRIFEDFPDARHRAMDGLRDQHQPYPLGLTMDNGAGMTYALDMALPGGAVMVMSRRDKALATALLELALENVRRSEAK